MVLIETDNQPIVFGGQEVIYASTVPTPQATVNVIIRTDNQPIVYSGQEVIK